MEDGLANGVFSFADQVHVLDRNKDMFFALLPTTLPLELIVIPSLIAGQRINNIIDGISIGTIHLLCFDWAKCPGCLEQG
jgi:hypothetical protein